MELHWLGVTTLANRVEVRGREKSQIFFDLETKAWFVNVYPNSVWLREVSEKASLSNPFP